MYPNILYPACSFVQPELQQPLNFNSANLATAKIATELQDVHPSYPTGIALAQI